MRLTSRYVLFISRGGVSGDFFDLDTPSDAGYEKPKSKSRFVEHPAGQLAVLPNAILQCVVSLREQFLKIEKEFGDRCNSASFFVF